MQKRINITYDYFFFIIKANVQPITEILDLINGMLILFLFYYFGKKDDLKKIGQKKVNSNRMSGLTGDDPLENNHNSGVSGSTQSQSSGLKEVRNMSLYQDKSVYFGKDETEENQIAEDNSETGSLFEEEVEGDDQENTSHKTMM